MGGQYQVDHKEIDVHIMDLMEQAQDRDHCSDLVNTILTLPVIQAIQLANIIISNQLCYVTMKTIWKISIKMDPKGIGIYVIHWLELPKDRDNWRALVNTSSNHRVT